MSFYFEVSAVVIVTRGTCTYTTKARNAQQAAANALLIVNNGQGLLHPPGPDGMDLGERSRNNRAPYQTGDKTYSCSLDVYARLDSSVMPGVLYGVLHGGGVSQRVKGEIAIQNLY